MPAFRSALLPTTRLYDSVHGYEYTTIQLHKTRALVGLVERMATQHVVVQGAARVSNVALVQRNGEVLLAVTRIHRLAVVGGLREALVGVVRGGSRGRGGWRGGAVLVAGCLGHTELRTKTLHLAAALVQRHAQVVHGLVHEQLLERPLLNVAGLVVLQVLDVAHRGNDNRSLVRVFDIAARHNLRKLHDAIVDRRAAAALHLLVVVLALAVKLGALALEARASEAMVTHKLGIHARVSAQALAALAQRVAMAVLLELAASQRAHSRERSGGGR